MTLGQYFWLCMLRRVFPFAHRLGGRAGIRCILQVALSDLVQIKAATSGNCREGSGEKLLEWRVAKLTDALLGWLLGVSVLKMHSLAETRIVGLLRVHYWHHLFIRVA